MLERARRNAPPLAPISVLAMTESRRHRFLPYLFEFIVVVLGVTVSFGLDGWRNDRQQARRHEQDVRALLADLARDADRLGEVEAFIEEGEAALSKILRITEAHRRGTMAFPDFAAQLAELGTPYRYGTFFMNNSTYKSLLSNGRLQLFPEAINTKLRDYYEYVSKRVEDNNDIVDEITLRYYNEDHPWVNYKHGAEALADLDIAHEVSGEIDSYFSGPGVREHYSQLSFLHGTLSVYDRVVTHGGQVQSYEGLRAELAGVIEAYAAERFR